MASIGMGQVASTQQAYQFSAVLGDIRELRSRCDVIAGAVEQLERTVFGTGTPAQLQKEVAQPCQPKPEGPILNEMQFAVNAMRNSIYETEECLRRITSAV